uniref:G-protein coupled receptors family 1 profile domain-containing protein n=1 Tax=Oncorhynchus tshawytscha TaxID=74940 RepID=A0A8C8CUV8_ONCTS
MSSDRSVLEGTGGAMNGTLRSVRKGISCRFQDPNCTRNVETLSSWNDTVVNEYRLVDLPSVTSMAMVQEASRHPFPTVDVPDHVHYTIGVVILAIGITGMVGNFLVIYAFSRSRSLRTPANMFIINLAITDLLMCLTQAPIFFTTSMHKRWIFGEKGCELYAFCGALFGICSMITLMVIAVDRYFVITRPLASIGVLSKKRAQLVLMAAWVYSLGWSLPPFFGWSAYVPEGLLTSCSWDYVTFTPSVRAYTMLLFTFVFFIPLIVIMYCYFFIFRAIRTTNRAVTKINCNGSTRDSIKSFRRLKNEWKMAKIALIVILLYVISWSPYSVVALTAFAGIFSCGYISLFSPLPSVFRMAIAKYIPCLGVLLCVHRRDLRSTDSSFMSTRRSTVTSQTSDISDRLRRTSTVKSHLSSASDSESGWTDTEADLSSMGSRPASRQVSCDISKDTTELPALKPYSSSSFNSKMKSNDSGIFEKAGDSSEAIVTRGMIGQIPSIVITSETSPFLPVLRASSRGSRTRPSNGSIDVGSVIKEPQESVQQRSTLSSDASTPLI